MTCDSAPAIVDGDSTLSYDELCDDPFGLRTLVQRGDEVSLRTDRPSLVAAAFKSLDGRASVVHLLPAGVASNSSEGWVTSPLSQSHPDLGEESGISIRRTRGHTETRWVLYTSGTSGAPKPVGHSMQSLSRTVSAQRHRYVWGLLYDPVRMAGVQVILQAVKSQQTLVAPQRSLSLSDKVRQLADHGVTAISATPTLWRQILQTPASNDLDLRQLTLGGEIADQRILDGLSRRFPHARIVHVFASTETGAAFSVADGRAGFPASYLQEPPNGIQVEIRNDLLHVFSPGSTLAGADGFVSTGDVVDIVDDRVIFKGRSSEMVNVGGSKVWPEQVEELLRQHPQVLDAVVSSVPNPLSGNLLVATVVPAPSSDHDMLRRDLRRWVRERAPGPMVPAKVTVAGTVTNADTGKAVR